MADYFPVLSRAVAGLPTNTGESRRAVYERARAAVIKQLRGIDPPLSEEDISRERMQLEDAIGRIEAGYAGQRAAPQNAAAAPAARPAPPPQGPRPVPQQQAPRPAPTPETRREPEPPREPDTRQQPERPLASPKRGPEVRADGRPIIRATGEPGAERTRRRSAPLIALGALAIIAIAAAGFAARHQIGSFLGGGGSTTTQTAAKDDASSPAPGSSEATPPAASGGKSDDRLLSDPTPATPEQPNAEQPPAQTDVARAPDPGPAVQPTAPTAPPQTPAPAVQPAGPLVAQRAILYEEGSDQQSGEQVDGTVVWRTESVNGGQNQPLETALRGDIDIPGRNVKATVTIRRNIDATLPASHTIEIQFKLPDNFPNAGVANVPGILMKVDEAARGSPVSGLSVRVTNGFFLIGLSNIENERIVNEQLLRDRGWIDIPILYDNGRRAVLTLEKGTPGAQAFNDALAAWQTAAAGGAPRP